MITKEEAIRLSKIKWQFIVDNDGSDIGLIQAHPELLFLVPVSFCGLCGYFRKGDLSNFCGTNTELCPLVVLDVECYSDRSAFSAWRSNKTKENAQRVLDLINQIK